MIPRLHRSSQSGVALLLTLAAVVLLTALVLAFFSSALINRQTSHSNTSIGKADLLARSALDIIKGELRQEITDPTRSTATPVSGGTSMIYVPQGTIDFPPASSGLSSSSGSVVEVSANNTPIRPNGSIQGSSIPIDTPSLNGRYLSAATWFTSTTDSPQLGNNGTTPTWMFMTRDDGVVTPSVVNAMDPKNKDYVLGRFAYTIYDIGGLLDANVAGYNLNNASVAANAVFKSSPAYADLTPLGLANLPGFVSWRNAATGVDSNSFQEWASGIPRSSGTPNQNALAAAYSGHRSVTFGDNAILSRHDLLNNANLSGAASYLTHFSRTINAPSYSPAAASITVTNPDIPAVGFSAAATSIIHYLDNGTTTTYSVAAGDPLVQHRFSLAKLSWLTYKGPSADLPSSDSLYNAAGTDAAILACFGLQWNSTNGWWLYTKAETTSPYHIKTLLEVSQESPEREPNFFELLSAGILKGSLGKIATTTSANGSNITSSAQPTLDANTDLQVLRIGANILNCARPDNYPAAIALNIPGTGTIPVYGVVDLPYLYGFRGVNLWQAAFYQNQVFNGTTRPVDRLNWCYFYLAPMLFNPHQSGVSNRATPANIRIRIASGTVTKMYNRISATTGGDLIRTMSNNLSDASGANAIQIPQSKFSDFQLYPRVVLGPEATTTTTLQHFVPSGYVDAAHGSIHSFLYYVYTGLPDIFSYTTTSSGALFSTTVQNLFMVLEYQDYQGNWRIYDSLGGNNAFLGASANGIGASTAAFDFAETTYLSAGTNTYTNPDQTVNTQTGTFIGKLDPRTSRFGVSRSIGLCMLAPTATPLLPLFYTTNTGNTGGVSMNGAYQYGLPFGTASAGATSGGTMVFPGLWVQGDKTGWSETGAYPSGSRNSTTANVADNDGVVRPADAWLGGTNTSMTPSPGNYLYTSGTAGNALRPVILHRPYQSVGELGYVFRDSPWKTLSFFDSTSGDGALMDLFTVADEPAVVAGLANLNSTQALVQQALLSGTGQGIDGSIPSLPNASSISTAYQSFIMASGSPSLTMPQNLGQLVSFMSSPLLNTAYPTATNSLKKYREAIVRSLAQNTQTRTWNLLIDVVAQTGRYPATAKSLNNFLVEGEKREWLSVSIDRYTGKVISEELEEAPSE